MNYESLFYWLVVADNARLLFSWAAGIFTIVVLALTVVYFALKSSDYEEGGNGTTVGIIQTRKWLWWATPICLLFWMLLVLTPSKKDSLLIVAGGGTLNYLVQDSTARQIPKQLTNFVVTELKTMAKENEVDLNIQNAKQKVLDEAKTLSTEELLQRMRTDSTFSKVLMED